MSHNRIEYREGELVGSHGCQYIKEQEPNIIINKRGEKKIQRVATFKCGFCSSLFDRRINTIKTNSQKSCGCLLVAIGTETFVKRDKKYPVGIRKQSENKYHACFMIHGVRYENTFSTLEKAIEWKGKIRSQLRDT
jgi:hypothetical protein